VFTNIFFGESEDSYVRREIASATIDLVSEQEYVREEMGLYWRALIENMVKI